MFNCRLLEMRPHIVKCRLYCKNCNELYFFQRFHQYLMRRSERRRKTEMNEEVCTRGLGILRYRILEAEYEGPGVNY